MSFQVHYLTMYANLYGVREVIDRVAAITNPTPTLMTIIRLDKGRVATPNQTWMLKVLVVTQEMANSVRKVKNDMDGWDVAPMEKEEPNLSPEKEATPVLHRPPEEVAARLLDLSFTDIKGQYPGLTASEKERCTEEEFRELRAWMMKLLG